MDCWEFQKGLERVMEGEPAAEALAHAEGCPVCAGLIEDLRLITRTSRLLEDHEPPARLWPAIEHQLAAEGLIDGVSWLDRLVAGFGKLVSFSPSPALSAVYVLLLVLGLTLVVAEFRQPSAPRTAEQSAQNLPAVEKAAMVNGYDKELEQLERVAMQRIAGSNPELHAAFAADLATVNEAIRTCHDTLEQEPDNHSTREQLYAAYQQKAVVLQSLLDPDLGL